MGNFVFAPSLAKYFRNLGNALVNSHNFLQPPIHAAFDCGFLLADDLRQFIYPAPILSPCDKMLYITISSIMEKRKVPLTNSTTRSHWQATVTAGWARQSHRAGALAGDQALPSMFYVHLILRPRAYHASTSIHCTRFPTRAAWHCILVSRGSMAPASSRAIASCKALTVL